MRLIISFFALSLLGALAQSGCNSAEQKNRNSVPVVASSPGVVAPAPSDGARRVTVAECNVDRGHQLGAYHAPGPNVLNREPVRGRMGWPAS